MGGVNHQTPKARRQFDREKREQTKFDKWLEERMRSLELVSLVLDPSPFSTDTLNEVPARIIEVDRYMICVEFQEHHDGDGVKNTYTEGKFWWVPKTSIMGAAASASL